MIQQIISNTDIKSNYAVLNLISKCRTGQLGHHEIYCNECGQMSYMGNSCRNRNCPTCQKRLKNKWIKDKKSISIPTKHYHVVATIPKVLYQIFYQNQEKMYKILLNTSAKSVIELCEDKKYLGVQVGIMQILHTWNQVLGYHPHSHMLVTAGGIDKLGRWKEQEKDYLLPVKVLSKKYRGKFIFELNKIKEELNLEGKLEKYKNKEEWNNLIKELYKENFVTYIKEPYENAETVIEYFGRYTHRVAISESRIKEYKNDEVTFTYHDRKDNNKEKIMKLSAKEFVRRFSMHILPKGFRKIRCYGLYANRNLKTKVKEIKSKLQAKISSDKLEEKEQEIDNYTLKCPKCGSTDIEAISLSSWEVKKIE